MGQLAIRSHAGSAIIGGSKAGVCEPVHTPLISCGNYPAQGCAGGICPLCNLRRRTPTSGRLCSPNAGLTEALISVGYVTTAWDPLFALSPEGTRYVSVPAERPTTLPPPGLPFSLVFRAEPGKEDILLKIASAYEAASRRRIPPLAFGP